MKVVTLTVVLYRCFDDSDGPCALTEHNIRTNITLRKFSYDGVNIPAVNTSKNMEHYIKTHPKEGDARIIGDQSLLGQTLLRSGTNRSDRPRSRLGSGSGYRRTTCIVCTRAHTSPRIPDRHQIQPILPPIVRQPELNTTPWVERKGLCIVEFVRTCLPLPDTKL